ncbi:tyrosine-type recombinase/integrase, partial [Staphylococcus equorum]|uniref:tyrosine-type recombinase/integrase n=1 Tax=Staphylococcus equorum TaxID=246432 RepID=UPI003EB6DE38
SLVGNFEIETQKRLNYWRLDQFNQFYDMLPNIQQKVFFKLLFIGGMRKGECRALTWEDINFDENFVHINKTDYHSEVTAPKTKAATR